MKKIILVIIFLINGVASERIKSLENNRNIEKYEYDKLKKELTVESKLFNKKKLAKEIREEVEFKTIIVKDGVSEKRFREKELR